MLSKNVRIQFSLWNLNSMECDRLYEAWNVTMRNVLNVDRKTHRYLIEHLSGTLHPKVMLLSRYVRFHKTLITSDKFAIRFLSRLGETDNRTIMGKTLSSIMQECNVKCLHDLTPTLAKMKCRYFPTPTGEMWRIPVIRECLDA